MSCCNCCKCTCHDENKKYGTGLPAYRLLKNIPSATAGTIFVLATSEAVGKTSRTHWLTNAWVNGNCQSMGKHAWCSGVIILPNDSVEETEFFQRIENHGRYTA